MRKNLFLLLLFLVVSVGVKGQYLQKGFWGGFEFAYGLSLSDKGDAFRQKFGKNARMQFVDLRSIFGYYITKTISVGTGVGVSTYSDPRVNLISVFLDFRYHPISAVNENFYIGFNIGTALADNQSKIDPRLFSEIFIGYKLVDIGNFTLAPSLGYSFYRYTIESFASDLSAAHTDLTQRRNSLFLRLSLTY